MPISLEEAIRRSEARKAREATRLAAREEREKAGLTGPSSSIQVNRPLLARLKAQAKAEGRTMSALATRVLEAYLQHVDHDVVAFASAQMAQMAQTIREGR